MLNITSSSNTVVSKENDASSETENPEDLEIQAERTCKTCCQLFFKNNDEILCSCKGPKSVITIFGCTSIGVGVGLGVTASTAAKIAGALIGGGTGLAIGLGLMCIVSAVRACRNLE